MDPLADAESRLIAAGCDAQIVRRTLAEIRRLYGGSEHYIPGRDRRGTDAAIREQLAAGEQPARIARVVGVSVSTIRRRKSQWLG